MNVMNNVHRLHLPGPHLNWWGPAVSPLPTRVRLPNKGQQGDLINQSEALVRARREMQIRAAGPISGNCTDAACAPK